MGLDTTIQCVPVDVGNVKEIPPDLPDGKWSMACTVTNGVNSKQKNMLTLTWQAKQALTSGNEWAEGKKTKSYLTIAGAGDDEGRIRSFRLDLKRLCDGLGIEIPTITSSFSWEQLVDFVEALEGQEHTVWTRSEIQKGGDYAGQSQTRVYYSEPRGGNVMTFPVSPSEPEEQPATKNKKSKR